MVQRLCVCRKKLVGGCGGQVVLEINPPSSYFVAECLKGSYEVGESVVFGRRRL